MNGHSKALYPPNNFRLIKIIYLIIFCLEFQKQLSLAKGFYFQTFMKENQKKNIYY